MNKLIFKTLLICTLFIMAACGNGNSGISDKYNCKGIKAEIKDGKVFVSLDKDALGTYIEGVDYNAINEVKGLVGKCKGIFIGEQGNEFNPILCILFDDGSVQVLRILDAYLNKNFTASKIIPTLKNIVKFETVIVKDSESSYSKINAIDKNGSKHDIPDEDEAEAGSNMANEFIGTNWCWSGSVTTEVIEFIDATRYSISTPVSDPVEGTYKLEMLDSGKRFITTNQGQYEISGETLIETSENGTRIFEKCSGFN